MGLINMSSGKVRLCSRYWEIRRVYLVFYQPENIQCLVLEHITRF